MLNSGNITFFSFLQAFLNLVFIAVSSEANGTLRGRLRIGHNACDVYRLCESANRHVNPAEWTSSTCAVWSKEKSD